jgi:uncharacterized membrane protein SpoIIM required for sporulation
MDINEAFRSAYAALVSEPSSVLPFYFMSVSVPAVARVAPLLTGVLAYLALLRRGRVDEIRSAVGELPLGDLEDPESLRGFEGVGDEFAGLFDLVFAPEVVALVAAAFLVFVVVVLGLNAVVSAGQVGAVYGVLMGDDEPVRRGVESIFARSSTFVLLIVAEAVLILGVTVVFGALGFVAASAGGLLGGALALLVAFLWLAAVVAVHVFFVFAPQSVVVDGTGLRGSLRGNLEFVLENPVEFVAYLIFAFAALVGFGSVAGFLNVLGAPAAVTVVGFVAFSPFVAVVKTDMYARHAGDEIEVGEGALETGRAADAVRDGLDEVAVFARARPGLVVASAALFFGSGVATWWATGAAGIGFETSIAERLAGTSPFGEFVNYTANNWAVGVAQTYAGFAFGFATVVSLLFNGFFLGFLSATEQSLPELVAFVVPHGVVEIPALLVSGALGLHLGGVAVGYARGGVTVDAVTREVRRAYRVLVGLLVVFAVAGLIEAFVSPYYYGPLLGL